MPPRLTRQEFQDWAMTQPASNPVIVVEVLSPSTQSIDSSDKLAIDSSDKLAIDSSDKLADYFRVPSIQHYLIVRAKRREIIHHSRTGSEIVARMIKIGKIVLNPPGIEIDLADVYGPAG